MVRAVLAVGETPHLCAVQRRTLIRSHGSDQSRATATAVPLSCRRNSTFRQALTSIHGAGRARQHDRSPPPPARGAGIATPSDSPAGVQVPFFAFFDDRGGTDVSHPRGIANAARIHRPIDDLLLDLRGETSVGILQKECPSTSSATRPTPRALLPF